MVPFDELISVVLSIETDQVERATAGFQFLSKWRLDANGYTEKLDEPLPGEPNLQLSDSGAGAVLKFLGTNEWTANLAANYQHGDYTNAIAYFSPSYNQWTESIGATYQPAGSTGPSAFDFAIGRTSRVSPLGVDDVSGTTGHLAYNRQLTGKTSISLAVDRNVASYLVNQSAYVDATGTISALWQATYKIGVGVGYNLIYALLPDQGFTPGTNRGDHLQLATLNVNYAALQWLSIKPYVNFQTRSSNYYGANFNSTVYGISFVVQWPQTTAAPTAQPATNAISGLPL
jgi:hypothetical protein